MRRRTMTYSSTGRQRGGFGQRGGDGDNDGNGERKRRKI
jgi:hypothetical protein